MNTNYNGSWWISKETNRDHAFGGYYHAKYGTDNFDLGGYDVKPNTTYYIMVAYEPDYDYDFEIRVDKYLDDIGDDHNTSGLISMNKRYTYNIENGSDQDCFEFTTGNTDYILTMSTIDNVRYGIYKDDLLTVPVLDSYGGYKAGTKVLDLSNYLNRNTKYWIAVWGTWSNDYEPVSYTFQFDTTFNLDTPSLKLTEKKGRKVKLTWSKVGGATGYEIYRAVGYGSRFKKIKTVKASAKRTWTSKKLGKGKTYCYKVWAYKTYKGRKYYSDGSNQVSKTYYSWS